MKNRGISIVAILIVLSIIVFILNSKLKNSELTSANGIADYQAVDTDTKAGQAVLAVPEPKADQEVLAVPEPKTDQEVLAMPEPRPDASGSELVHPRVMEKLIQGRRRDFDGLQEEILPDNSRRINLKGRFKHIIIATKGEDGQLVVTEE